MRHYLIGISDLTSLTTRELRDLDAKLTQLLDHDTGLTDADFAKILASLKNIRAAFDLRHVAIARQL